MNLPYVERSAKIAEALDPEQIAGMYIGDVTYENNFFARHALGRVLLGGETVYLGLELPKHRCSSQLLFMNNLQQISDMIEEDPELLPYAPSFVGALSGNGEQAKAVLTEDLTQGGRCELEPGLPSDELQKKGVQLGIELAGPHALTTAQPNGQEKIISFFPAPFIVNYDVHDLLNERMSDAQSRLTVPLCDNSVLAADINRHVHIPV